MRAGGAGGTGGAADTVTLNAVVTDLPAAFVTTTVIVAVPDAVLAGVSVNVRLAPDPPSAKPPADNRVALDDVAVTVNAPAAVAASPTVNDTWPVLLYPIVRLPIGDIVGAAAGGDGDIHLVGSDIHSRARRPRRSLEVAGRRAGRCARVHGSTAGLQV